MRSHSILGTALGAIAAAQIAAGVAVAIVAAQPVAHLPVFSEAQARRGEALYADNCTYCHLVDLSGGELAPPLTGPAFVARWTPKPLSELFDYMRVAMPFNSPGGLSAQQNADILAFILRKANVAPGATDLPARSEALSGVRLH